MESNNFSALSVIAFTYEVLSLRIEKIGDTF